LQLLGRPGTEYKSADASQTSYRVQKCRCKPNQVQSTKVQLHASPGTEYKNATACQKKYKVQKQHLCSVYKLASILRYIEEDMLYGT